MPYNFNEDNLTTRSSLLLRWPFKAGKMHEQAPFIMATCSLQTVTSHPNHYRDSQR